MDRGRDIETGRQCLCFSDLNHRATERERYTDRRRERHTGTIRHINTDRDAQRQRQRECKRSQTQTPTDTRVVCSLVGSSNQTIRATWLWPLLLGQFSSPWRTTCGSTRAKPLTSVRATTSATTKFLRGAALVRCTPYLTCWQRAGLAKIARSNAAQHLKLLEVNFAHEFPLNPIPDVDVTGFCSTRGK